MNPATVRLAQNGGSTVVATVDLSADGLTVTLSPESDLSPSTLYRVTLSADITDPAGNALAAFASSFTTAAANTPPVADAGPDQVVFVGETAFLDGGGSTDADGDALTYRWSLTTVPTVASRPSQTRRPLVRHSWRTCPVSTWPSSSSTMGPRTVRRIQSP